MKLAPFGGTHVAIALTIGFAALIPACGGDDTGTGSVTGVGGGAGTGGGGAGTGGTAGTGGGGGNRDGSVGGSAGAGGVGTGGAAGTGGSIGTGGTAGTGGGAGAEGGTGGSIGEGGVRPDAQDAALFAPQILFSFDPTDAGGTYGWGVDLPSSGSTVALVNDDRDPANQTPGSLEFRVVFPPYVDGGTSAAITTQFFYGDPNTGTKKDLAGASRLHFWLKVVTFPAPSLLAVQPWVQGGNASGYNGNFSSYNTNIADNNWHEYVLDVAGTAYIADVWNLSVKVVPQPQPQPSADDGGGANDGGGTEAAATDGGLPVTDGGPDGATDGGVSDGGGVSTEAGEASSEAAATTDGGAPESGTVDAGAPVDAGGAGPAAPAPVVIRIDYIWAE